MYHFYAMKFRSRMLQRTIRGSRTVAQAGIARILKNGNELNSVVWFGSALAGLLK
jgi:hypothetical protein